MAKSLKVHITIAIALLISFALLVGNINYSFAFAEAYEVSGEAQGEKQWSYDEVSSLEQLREVPVEQIASWSQYDSRDYGIVTPVKDQGAYNLCWAYSSISSMETSILREGIKYPSYADTPDLSPLALAMATKGWFDDPLDLCDVDNTTNFGSALTQSDWDVGGITTVVGVTASKWYGLYQQGDDYNNAFKDDKKSAKEQYSPIRLENILTANNNEAEIKELVATYGSVAFAYDVSGIGRDYFKATGSSVNHMSVIVGWDDNVSVREFANAGYTVSKPGAWIVKNSWGTWNHNNGYYYLSYESKISSITAFDMMGENDYDYNYNYAGNAPKSTDYPYRDAAYNNKFIAAYEGQKGTDGCVEYLKGVNVGIYGKDVTAEVRIYTNVDTNTLTTFNPESTSPAVTTTKSFKYPGIYTIEMPSKVEITAGEYYLIYVYLKSGTAPYGIIYESGAAELSNNDLTFYCAAWANQWTNFKEDNYISTKNSVALIRGLTVVESDDSVSIAGCSITLDKNTFTYDGTAHEPKATVQLTGKILVEGADYTVTYQNNTNAGQGCVTIVGKGDYRGTETVYFTIEKAEHKDFKVFINDWTYGQTANNPYFQLTDAEQGIVTYMYSSSPSGNFSANKPSQAGTYYVKAVMAETDNYHSVEAIAGFAIQKAHSPKFDGSVEIEIDEGEKGTLSEIDLPENWQWKDGNTTISGSMTAMAIYVGDDADNYLVTEIQISITVNSTSEPEPEPDNPTTPDQPTKPDDPTEPDTPGEDEKPDDSEGDNTVAVAVGVTTGVVGAGALGGVAFWFVRRRRRR